MIRVSFSIFLALLFLLPVEVFAQGFSAYNNRNHPELSWMVAETEHFKIAYPERIAGIEIQAGSVAEAAYETLSQNLGVSFDKKIRIYLSDEDENTNGFAVPIGSGHTNIWVNVNDAATLWTGEEKWLRKVVAHELAHIFHFKAVRSPFHPLNYAIANPLPSFWTEGIAQYETEVWDAYRGEQVLRTAVLDDQLSYKDGRSIRNGALRYAVGNSQVRFFAEHYGDSTLSKLLSTRESAIFGLAKYHDFGAAFKKATDVSYRDFYDRWRRHINVRYNSLAAGMENADSLGTEPLEIPGQYIYDVSYSPDRSQVAMIAMQSLSRPIRQLLVKDLKTENVKVIAEGSIRSPLSWNHEGNAIVYTRNARAQNGSFVNDLFLARPTGGSPERLTYGRRASSPSFSPDGNKIAFVGSSNGTGNVFELDLESTNERALTSFSGDVQLGQLQWHPDSSLISFSGFYEDGKRTLAIVNARTLATQLVTDGVHDDRNPIWAPGGKALAYTSLRDGVPNVFECRLTTDEVRGNLVCADHRRLTNLVTGAIAADWISIADTTSITGSSEFVVARVSESKTRDKVYHVPLGRQVFSRPVTLPPAYDSWTQHRPPATLPATIEDNSEVIESRGRYKPLRNLSHVASIVLPYISAARYGIGGLTIWSEPLAKHMGYAGLGVDARDPFGESGLMIGYINNTLRPSITTEIQYIPDSPRPYGKDLLLERITQVTVQPTWHLNTSKPYRARAISVKLGFINLDPRDDEDIPGIDQGLPVPETGQQFSLRLAYTRKHLRPWVDNLVHPLDGFGVRVRVTGAAQGLEKDQNYLRLDLATYKVLPVIRNHRFFAYGRLQAQSGESLAQDFLGLSRYDILQVSAPSFISFQSSNSERVRGYREFALGKAIFFGSVEYRLPLTRSLDTELFGLIGLGSTSLAVFADGAIVSPNLKFGSADRRLGLGVELKNAITFGGILSFMHAVGVAQKSPALGTNDDWEVYYRIRTTLPF